MVYAGNGSGIFSDVYARFLSTTTLQGTTAANAWKFVFGSNGPGGITELTMLTQTGWTRTNTGNTSIQMTNAAGTYVIQFNWGREIPYVYFSSSALWNNPSAGFGSAGMRYIPVDSSDYVTHYVTSILNETYGYWSPAAATVFSNMRRQRIYSSIFDYTTPGGTYDPGFPSTITVEPA
tara:strand:- start:251 stop:784 length:534 start_codon:yes stop_codon:yes gene_type:complete